MSGERAGGLRTAWDNDFVRVVGTFVALYAVYVVLGVIAGIPAQGLFATLVDLTVLIAFYAMLTLALNLHWGYTGLFNIGIVGFLAVGAYTTLILVNPAPGPNTFGSVIGGFGLPFPVGVVGAVLAAALVGLIVGLPALRLRADYFAITTIAFAEIIRFVFQSGVFAEFEVFGRTVGTGGGGGLTVNFDEPLSKYLLDTDAFAAAADWVEGVVAIQGNLQPVLESAVVGVVLMGVVMAYYWLFKRTGESPFGRVLKAIDEDEGVARALGKNTSRFKIASFMLGCALMGLVGSLYAVYFLGSVTPPAFRPQFTFFVWVALIIGGAGSNTGSVIGAAIFVGVLLQGPLLVRNVVTNLIEIPSAPPTVIDAVAGLASIDPAPLLAYTLANINLFRIIALGLVLIWLMKRRPEGLLGHRKETAAAIDLRHDASGPAESGGADE